MTIKKATVINSKNKRKYYTVLPSVIFKNKEHSEISNKISYFISKCNI